MAGTTGTGFPYPDPGDAIRLGADAIKALANVIPLIQAGTVTLTPTTVDTAFAQAVVFTRPFPGQPFVIVGSKSGPPSANYGLAFWATAVTANGFNLVIKRQTLTASTADWIAYYPPLNV